MHFMFRWNVDRLRVAKKEQHGSVYAPLPLLRRIDDRREDGLAAAACDHVVARCVGRGGGGLNVGRLAREEDGVAVNISLSLQSLIEEENVSQDRKSHSL